MWRRCGYWVQRNKLGEALETFHLLMSSLLDSQLEWRFNRDSVSSSRAGASGPKRQKNRQIGCFRAFEKEKQQWITLRAGSSFGTL
jgi:hypothetical protein